jgi:hypothetical protein
VLGLLGREQGVAAGSPDASRPRLLRKAITDGIIGDNMHLMYAAKALEVENDLVMALVSGDPKTATP